MLWRSTRKRCWGCGEGYEALGGGTRCDDICWWWKCSRGEMLDVFSIDFGNYLVKVSALGGYMEC